MATGLATRPAARGEAVVGLPASCSAGRPPATWRTRWSASAWPLLVAAALFQLVSGVLNIARWYAPMPFFFTAGHYWVAWLAVGALLVHIGVKLPVIRLALARRPRRQPRPGVSRRGLLGAVGAAAGADHPRHRRADHRAAGAPVACWRRADPGTGPQRPAGQQDGGRRRGLRRPSTRRTG